MCLIDPKLTYSDLYRREHSLNPQKMDEFPKDSKHKLYEI